MSKTINFFQQGHSVSELQEELHRLFPLKTKYNFNSESEKELAFVLIHGNAYIDTYSGNKDELDILLNFYFSAIPAQYNPLPAGYKYLTEPVLALVLKIFNTLEKINPQSKSNFLKLSSILEQMKYSANLDNFVEKLMNIKSSKVCEQILKYLSRDGDFKIEDKVKLSLLTTLDLDRKLSLIECVINRVLKQIETETLVLSRTYHHAYWLAESYTTVKQNESKKYQDLPFKIMEISNFVHKYTVEYPVDYIPLAEKYDAIGRDIYGDNYQKLKEIAFMLEQKMTFKEWSNLKTSVFLETEAINLPTI